MSSFQTSREDAYGPILAILIGFPVLMFVCFELLTYQQELQVYALVFRQHANTIDTLEAFRKAVTYDTRTITTKRAPRN